MVGVPSSHLILAEDAIQRGDGRKALDHLARLTDLDMPEPWVLRAQALLLLGQPQAAREASNSGLEVDPTNAALLLTLAQAESASHQPARAEQALLAILNREPEHQLALFHYADLLMTSGDPAAASDIVEQLEAPLRTTGPALALRARIASALGQENEAADLTKLATHLDPDSVSVDTHPARAVPATGHDQPLAPAGSTRSVVDHPLMAPIRWIERIGPGRLWIGWIAMMVIGRRVLPAPLVTVLTLGYFALVVYSWIVPFVFRKWLTR